MSANKNIDLKTFDNIDFYIRDSQVLDSILNSSILELKVKKIIASNEVPLKLAFKKWLVDPKYIEGEQCNYQRWEHNIDYFEIWAIEFSNLENKFILESRIDSICNNLLSIKISYQKKFRGHKLYNNKLVLFKHNFFSKEKINEYQELVDYLDKDFTCW